MTCRDMSPELRNELSKTFKEKVIENVSNWTNETRTKLKEALDSQDFNYFLKIKQELIQSGISAMHLENMVNNYFSTK